jgi:hypothetical protein
VEQDVGALGRGNERGGGCGVAADDRGTSFVVEAVADGGFDRLVVDAKRGNLQFVVLENYDLVSGFNRRQVESLGFTARTL